MQILSRADSSLKTLLFLVTVALLVSLKICTTNFLMSFGILTVRGISFFFFFHLLLVLGLTSLAIKYRLGGILFIVYALYSFLLFGEFEYFRYSGTYITAGMWLGLLHEGKEFLAGGSVPLYKEAFVVFADLPLLILIAVIWRKKPLEEGRNPKLIPQVSIISWGMWLLGVIVIFVFDKSPMSVSTTGPYQVVARYGVLGKDLVGIVDALAHKNLQVTYGPLVEKSSEEHYKRNIVFIQVESLDANIIDHAFNGKLIAPYLSSLSKRSRYYPYFLSYVGASGSFDAEIAALNSIEPSKELPMSKMHIMYPNSIAGILSSNGYVTEAFHDNHKQFFLRGEVYNALGFQRFIDIHDMQLRNYGFGGADGEMFRFITNRLDSIKTPFMWYIITVSSHQPFDFVHKYAPGSQFSKVGNHLVRSYYESISYVDSCLAEFLPKLLAIPQTIVFIFGDHPPGLKVEEYSDGGLWDGRRYFRLVPLFVLGVDANSEGTIRYLASELDLGETALEVAGVHYQFRSLGANLLGHSADTTRVVYESRSFDRRLLFEVAERIMNHKLSN